MARNGLNKQQALNNFIYIAILSNNVFPQSKNVRELLIFIGIEILVYSIVSSLSFVIVDLFLAKAEQNRGDIIKAVIFLNASDILNFLTQFHLLTPIHFSSPASILAVWKAN